MSDAAKQVHPLNPLKQVVETANSEMERTIREKLASVRAGRPMWSYGDSEFRKAKCDGAVQALEWVLRDVLDVSVV